MPGETFDRIASGGGGPSAVALLRDTQYSRRLVLLRAVADLATRRGGTGGGQAAEAWCLLATAQRRSPAVVRDVLMYPSVGPANLRALSRLSSPRRTTNDDATAGTALAVLAAAATVRTGLTATVRLPVWDERIVLPSLGRARFPGLPDGTPATVWSGPSGAAISADGHWVPIPGRRPSTRVVVGGGAAVWEGLRRLVLLDHGAPLLLDDVDPHSLPVSNRCARLPDPEWRRWRRVVTDGWRLLRSEHPEVAAEAAAGLRVLVPIAGAVGSKRSVSSQETFGCAALTTPVSAVDLALRLTHELQHNKLAALLHFLDLTVEEPGELFYAPWRADPRPLVALLHGVYAHVGVAHFWHRRCLVEYAPGARYHAQVELVRWRSGARQATGSLLGSGRLTALGVRFVTRMRQALDELAVQPVPGAALREGMALSAEHRRQWEVRHGGVAEGSGR